ncbi:MAG: PD-(D/E)XK nuclease family protein [Pleurocapsa minor GSE-CHR-MK-17-07R]|jgi:RecB family exonuclease|nr:PD-(D/E)XK nuclease family protein [Pleurocapsa minor GSE-CHR-MK 17-07R]
MTIPEAFTFSQSSLNDYLDCQRRFELRYLMDARWPAETSSPANDFEAAMLRGADFHRMIHQHTLGVPESILTASVRGDEKLANWWKSWLSWQAAHIPHDVVRYAEISLGAPIADFRLQAKYDMIVVLPDGTLHIYDWKTGKRPKQAHRKTDMQSDVYRFVLAQAGGWLIDAEAVPPERIRMTYWYAQDGLTDSLTYDAASMHTGEMLLSQLVADITATPAFPLTAEAERCKFCVYRSLCDRGTRAGHFETEDLTADAPYDDAATPFMLDDDLLNSLEM